MTESNKPNTQRSSASRVAQIAWGVFICGTLYVCYFSHLGVIGFVGPDEPRYAWIARDMMETNDWVTPRLYGKPWFEKPPLLYWAAGLCFKRFGVSEASARLPSAICALLATLALAWLAWRLYGGETARWLLLFLPTTVGMIGFSHAAATDMPFSAMLTIAMVCAAVVLGLTRNENTPILPRTPWVALSLFGFFLGLATLAKGPAAVVLSGGAVSFWALFTKRRHDAFRLFHPIAIISFCATSLPWYILCARRNPDFFRVFIIEHNFKRYLTPEFQHIQPFWFYVPVLLVAFLPWTALLLWSALTAAGQLWRTRFSSHATVFFLCWAGFCFLFFSASQSKLPGYVLPALPAIGLLVDQSISMIEDFRKSLRLFLLVSSVLLFGLFGMALSFPRNMSQTNRNFAAAAGLVLGFIGLTNLLFGILFPAARKSGLVSLATASAVLPILTIVAISGKMLPSFFPGGLSGRTIARELQLRKIPLDNLAIGSMNRGMQYSLNFYLHKEIGSWNQENSDKEYILSSRPSCRVLVPPPFACEPLPFDDKATGFFLIHVVMTGSVGGAADGRQADKKE